MLDVIRHDAVTELRLARPPVNAIDPAMARELVTQLKAAPAAGARAIVLSGQPGRFSGGLDVPALLKLDRDGIIAFWSDFFAVMATLARSPVPVVAAITGHSPAGGAVMSIFCDYRVMARGPFRIGLNEVQVGLTVPEVIQLAFKRLVGAHRAERLMVAGAMVEPEQALEYGMVDELTEPDNVVARALAWCDAHLRLPPLAMSATRRLARRDLADLMGDVTRFPVDDFAASWFADETQSTLRGLFEKKSK